MSYFVAARFALFGAATQLLKGFEKEGFNVMRLQAAGLGPFHVLADALDAADIHDIMRQRPVFEQV